MYRKFTFLIAPLCLFVHLLAAQVPKDAVLPVTASFTTSPGSVTLTWPNPAASKIVIFRHTKNSPPDIWFSMLNVTASTQTTFTDNLVSAGQTYEYIVQRTAGSVVSNGYAYVAMNAPVVDNRGKLLFFVDSTLMGPLANEVGQLKLDMMGDGWTIVPHIIGSGATVQSIKNQIVADYNADASNVKMVFLLGALPVPYSGDKNWDDKPDHTGAWPADSYYADVNGVWTDVTVNNPTPARAANDNVPGDGKFDQNVIPGNVELAVGRVDFRHLSPTTFGTSQVELYRRYLNKNHAWRLHQYTVENKALIDDHFGYVNGEAFAANLYRNAYPLMPTANVVAGDFFADTYPSSYLLGMATGDGTYSSITDVGTSAQFASDTVNVVFSMMFGRYSGDWDSETDPFMPAALASKGGLLTCSWAGRPHLFYQGLAGGEPIGFCTKETQNAIINAGYFPSFGESGAHVALLGDPTLRAHVVAPPQNLVAEPLCGSVRLHWTPPAGGAPEGYHVYRSLVRNGNYERLTTATVNDTAYVDLTAPTDTIFYQVRTIRLENTPAGGKYFNSSTGASAFLVFAPGNPPTLTTTGAVITCSQQAVSLVVSSSLPLGNTQPQWEGPGGVEYTGSTVLVDEAGEYTVTVTAANGCTATGTATVTTNTVVPTFSGVGGTVTCNNPTVSLSATNDAGSVSWTGPNGFTSTSPHPVVSAAGIYAATITSANGCSQTGTVNVMVDTMLPVLSLPALPALTCSQVCIDLVLPPIPGHQIYVDGTLLLPGVPLGICLPGMHVVSLRSLGNGCQDDYPVVINQDVVPPGASATGGVLTCNTTLQLHGSSNTPNVLYQWMGPGGFTSAQQNPSVSAPGTYTLIVVNPANGCTSMATATVSSPSAPNVSANGTTLSCSIPSDDLEGSSTTPGVTYAWSGPDGFTSTEQNPVVSSGGVYVLIVTAPNGCMSTASATVTVDMNIPQVSAEGAVLPCNPPTATLQGSSTTPGVTYTWSGPAGFTSANQQPTVSVPGFYILEVEAPNGCTDTDTVEVTQAPSLQSIEISGMVNCDSTATLSAQVLGGTLPYHYLWSTGDTTSFLAVALSGTLTFDVTVTDAAGCTDVSLNATFSPTPSIQITGVVTDEKGTAQDGAIEVSVTAGACQDYIYIWSNGAHTPSLTNLSAGTYTVTVTCAVTGCTSVATFEVHSITVGTEEVAFWQKIVLSPNPAGEEARLEVQFPIATAMQVKLVDATGRIRLILPETTIESGSWPIDLRTCPPGLYTVLLTTRSGTATRKLAVIK